MIYALHGFLGLPSDWDFLSLPSLVAVDLFSQASLSPTLGLEGWAKKFNETIAPTKETRILIGYSLGGRLAMHLLIDQPQLWQAAVIISAHAGGLNEAAQQKRYREDLEWAERFVSEPWPILMQAWNQRGPLAVSETRLRHECDYDRQRLAEALKGWSLATQRDLRSELSKLSMPILWLTGEKDRTYSELSKEISLRHTKSKKAVVPNSGHRLPWDNSESFRKELSLFIENLGES